MRFVSFWIELQGHFFSGQLMDVFGKEGFREKEIFLIWLGDFLVDFKNNFSCWLIE